MDRDKLPDQRELWPERLRRVRRSQERTEIRGMTRPPRDPAESAFLEEQGSPGPFPEDPSLPEPSVARRRRAV